MDRTEHARCDKVLAIGPATPRIECARGDGSGEGKVRHDAVVDRRALWHAGLHAAPPGTLNVLLPDPFDQSLFTGRFTSAELGGHIEDHPYAPVVIERTIPGLVIQTLNPRADQPSEVVELIADRHLRTTLGLTDGARVTFELK